MYRMHRAGQDMTRTWRRRQRRKIYMAKFSVRDERVLLNLPGQQSDFTWTLCEGQAQVETPPFSSLCCQAGSRVWFWAAVLIAIQMPCSSTVYNILYLPVAARAQH